MYKAVSSTFVQFACFFILLGTLILSTKKIFFQKDQKPILTLIIIVDQMAWMYLKKIKPFITGGLQQLTNNGLIFENCHMPHAYPSTAPGHTAFNMGSFPESHGIVANKWIDKEGNKISCDSDEQYKLFNNQGILTNRAGRSPLKIQGSGLSESCALASTNNSFFHVYALSGKSRGAICTANKLGKALWFDDISGGFISSNFYFTQLPGWLITANEAYDISSMQEYTWKSYFPLDHAAYQFPLHNNYEFTAPQESFIEKTYPLDTKNSFRNSKKHASKGRFSYLQNTPFMNEYIFKYAKTIIENTIIKNNNDKLLLWLSLSSLDKVGHIMGPSSNEVLDILYHLDAQLKTFFDWIDQHIGLNKTLIVLTADHGVTDIPEIAYKKGLINAQRIGKSTLKQALNTFIYQETGIQEGVIAMTSGQLHLSPMITHNNKRKIIEKKIIKYLKKLPYIHNAWSLKTIKKNYCCDPITLLFKRQIFPGRTGHILFQKKEHSLITHYADGTAHDSVYADDTHIPLIWYQKNKTKPRLVHNYVYAQQLPNTIALELEVAQVANGMGQMLPQQQ